MRTLLELPEIDNLGPLPFNKNYEVAMQAQPQTKTNEIIERLSLVKIRSKENVSSFMFKSFHRDAKNLVKVCPSEGYMVLGVLSCLEFDDEQMHAFHRNSITLSSGGNQEYLNYITSLEVACLWKEAFDISTEAFNKEKNDIERLTWVLDHGENIFHFHQIDQYLKLWDKLSPKDSYPRRDLLCNLKAFLDNFSISEFDTLDYFSRISSVMHNSGVIVSSRSISIDNDLLVIDYMLSDDSTDVDFLQQKIKESVFGTNADKFISINIINKDLEDLVCALDSDITPENIVEPDYDQLKRIELLVSGVGLADANR